MTLSFTNADWNAIAPIDILAAAGLAVLLADLFAGRKQWRYASIVIGLLGVLVAAIVAGRQFGHQ